MVATLFPGYIQFYSPTLEALANGRRRQAIMQEVMSMPQIENKWGFSRSGEIDSR